MDEIKCQAVQIKMHRQQWLCQYQAAVGTVGAVGISISICICIGIESHVLPVVGHIFNWETRNKFPLKRITYRSSAGIGWNSICCSPIWLFALCCCCSPPSASTRRCFSQKKITKKEREQILTVFIVNTWPGRNALGGKQFYRKSSCTRGDLAVEFQFSLVSVWDAVSVSVSVLWLSLSELAESLRLTKLLC